MKTGNAILASFFFGMSIYVPIKLLSLMYQYNALIKYLPTGLDSISFVLIVFIVFTILGAVFLISGRQPRERKEKNEYQSPEKQPEIYEQPRKDKVRVRFQRPDDLNLEDLVK
jgi:hypothetical protein